jgi:hypothetical protein
MRKAFAITVLFCSLACTKVGVTHLGNAGSYAPKPENCALDVFSSSDEIKQKYVEVCLIDSRTGSTLFHDKSAAAAVDHARADACKCGADALLIQSTDTKGVSMSGWGEGKAIVKAIRYVKP